MRAMALFKPFIARTSGIMRKRLQVIAQLTKRHPHIILVPLALLALLLGVGIWGVRTRERTSYTDTRDTATWEASAAALSLKADISQAVNPLQQLGDIARNNPNVTQFLKLWDATAASYWQTAPESAVSIQLVIQGYITRISVSPNVPDTGTAAFIGQNMLDPGNPYRMLVLAGMAAKTMALQGPFFPEGSEQVGYNLQAAFTYPVFLPITNANETWGYGREVSGCPPGLCYNPMTKMKFWGMFSMTVGTSPLLNESRSVVAITQKGYRMMLTRKGDEQFGEPALVTLFTTSNATAPPPHAIQVPVTAINQEWALWIWKGDTWGEDVSYLYAVVVLGAVIFCVLVGAMLLSWAENRELLHSVLSKETIHRMREEAHWATSKLDEFKAMQIETPAQTLLYIISCCLDGVIPSISRLVAMRDALHRSVDIYRPTANTFKEKIQKAEFMDAEVQQALVNQLVDARASNAVCDLNEEHHSGPQPFSLADEIESRKMSEIRTSSRLPPGYSISALNERGLSMSAAINKSVSQLSHMSASSFTRAHSTAGLYGAYRPTTLSPLGGPNTDLKPIAATLTKIMQAGQPTGHATEATFHPLGAALPVVRESDMEGSRSSVMRGSVVRIELSDSGPGLHRNSQSMMHPEPGIMTQLERVISTAGHWAFDAYALDEASCGHPLSVLAYWIFHTTGIVQWAHMDVNKLVRFLQRVEEGYSSNNPYHNRRHAADVLQSIHVILHRGGLVPHYAESSSLLAVYLAAIIHDYDHRGRNNDYLVNSYHELAVRYNDRSPMENHHLAAAFELLRQPEYDCLSGVSRPMFHRIRKLVIDLVLATDMKQHYAILGQFDALYSVSSEAAAREGSFTSDTRNPDSLRNTPTTPTSPPSPRHTTPSSEVDRVLCLQMAIKMADLGHLTAPLQVHLKWASALEEEFFQQGDAERAQGLPISPLCDRSKEGIYKSQVGFFSFVALPLYSSMAKRFPDCKALLSALKSNHKYWASQTNNGKLTTRPSSASMLSRDSAHSTANSE